MAYVLRILYEGYDYYFREVKDKRSENFFLMSTPPIGITLILVGYLVLIKKGPKYMEKREPFDLKGLMMVYNFIQVILNLMLGILGTYTILWANPFNHYCQNVRYTTDAIGKFEVRMTFCYFMLKLLDLMDTIFIILKKKSSNLSFLHTYHHFFMTMGGYIAVRWLPGGHGCMLGLINCFVHAFMYSYYFLCAFKPDLKKSIWWKKHITQIQLAQFAYLIFHFGRPAIFGVNDCTYPRFWLWVVLIQNLFMFSLFGDFYIKAYIKKRSTKVL